MLSLLDSSMSESVMTWKGFVRFGSFSAESCPSKCSAPASEIRLTFFEAVNF